MRVVHSHSPLAAVAHACMALKLRRRPSLQGTCTTARTSVWADEGVDDGMGWADMAATEQALPAWVVKQSDSHHTWT